MIRFFRWLWTGVQSESAMEKALRSVDRVKQELQPDRTTLSEEPKTLVRSTPTEGPEVRPDLLVQPGDGFYHSASGTVYYTASIVERLERQRDTAREEAKVQRERCLDMARQLDETEKDLRKVQYRVSVMGEDVRASVKKMTQQAEERDAAVKKGEATQESLRNQLKQNDRLRAELANQSILLDKIKANAEGRVRKAEERLAEVRAAMALAAQKDQEFVRFLQGVNSAVERDAKDNGSVDQLRRALATVIQDHYQGVPENLDPIEVMVVRGEYQKRKGQHVTLTQEEVEKGVAEFREALKGHVKSPPVEAQHSAPAATSDPAKPPVPDRATAIQKLLDYARGLHRNIFATPKEMAVLIEYVVGLVPPEPDPQDVENARLGMVILASLGHRSKAEALRRLIPYAKGEQTGNEYNWWLL